jgi:DeoR/GlpR family transcriptional regulator of sugar metabolism
LKVTAETVRRDLERLEKEGLVRRSYGGAVSSRPSTEDLSFQKRTMKNATEKEAIAQKALELINQNGSLMVDSSSTVLSLMKHLSSAEGLTVITNSVKLLADFAGTAITLVGTGGHLRGHSLAMVGETATRSLRSYNVDLALVSCKGLDMEKGVMESNEPEALVKQVMVNQAKTSVLLADHSKFDQIAFTKAFDFKNLDYVVTDREPSQAWLEFFKKTQIKIIF